jgi:hypothetical protein
MSKLIFKNNVGKVYDDKIALGSSKFFNNEIKSIKLIKTKNNTFNYISLLIAFFCFYLSSTDYLQDFNFLIITNVIAVCFFILYISYNNNKYFIKINFNTPNEKKIFTVRKQYKEDAKEFITIIKKMS